MLRSLPPHQECIISCAPNGKMKQVVYSDKTTVLMVSFKLVTHYTSIIPMPGACTLCEGEHPYKLLAFWRTNTRQLDKIWNAKSCKPHQFNLLYI